MNVRQYVLGCVMGSSIDSLCMVELEAGERLRKKVKGH